MAKPYMCGDELPVYIPSGGCDCNYTLRRVESDQYESSYELMLNGSRVGDIINIPKDNYVNNCILATVGVPEVPYAGAEVGDPYLDISFVNEERHVYVPLDSIVGGGYTIVDTLPDTGDSKYIYLVDDGAGNYDRYVWDSENSEWVNIGGTEIDLSDYYTKDEVDGMISNIMLRVYPIGSIYVSVNSTNPGTIFGGTWEQIEDKFLLASGTTYTAGTTGGEATHTLIESELPHVSGNLDVKRYKINNTQGATVSGASGAFSISGTSGSGTSLVAQSDSIAHTVLNYSFGSDQAHENMPPYLAVYMWKRTA